MAINIYLSVNNAYLATKNTGRIANNENFMIMPVIPSEFAVNKPKNIQEFETISMSKLAFICPADLKSISWSCFFPTRDYSYVRGTRLKAFDYVYMLDVWEMNKTPMRLTITGLDSGNLESIHMACCIRKFDYKIGTDGDLYYDIELGEYPLVDATAEEGLTMTQYEELKDKIDQLARNFDALNNGYQTLDDIPDYAKETIKSLTDNGYILGEGELIVDENTGDSIVQATGNLNLTDQMLRVLVIGYRAGAYGK